MPKPSKKKQRSKDLKKERIHKLLNLGMQFHQQKNVQAAEEAYRRVIDVDPLNFKALYLIAVLFSEVGNFKDAIEFMDLAIKVNPKYSPAHNDKGVMLQQIGNIKGAMECYATALELNAGFSEAMNNMGVIYGLKGNAKKSQECFAEAVKINPLYFDANNNLIFIKDLSINETVQSLIDVRKQWSKTHEDPLLAKQKPFKKYVHSKIRIGYVSGDFRLHSASFVFGGMLTEYDKDKFEVYAYSNLISKPDIRTQTFKESVTAWRDIQQVSDEQLVNLMRKDEIDIAVDLTGFSSGSRLLAFARRCAPIQITAWGYATSTGMKSMDAFFADSVIVPPEEKDQYVEKVIYLPNVVTHYCPEKRPDILELPALKNGHITFGSFNRFAKVSEECFRLWVDVLKAVPNSRMVLKISEEGDTAVVAWATDNFKRAGIAEDRLTFLGKTNWYDHMGHYNQFDVALDTFPHGGGVTTLESLQMGIPVVTLKHPTIVGRLSASILTTLEMTDWIAETKEDYIRIAIEKAKDIQALSELRNNLRSKMESSIIGDYKSYCRAVETEYEKLHNRITNSNT